MPGFRAALRVEALKARRSIVPPVTALAFCIGPVVGGLFMFILADPGRARTMGLIGQKAQIAGGSSDWPAFLAFLAETGAVGGFILFAFVVAWVFGREFSDGTVRYLLALPTTRTAIIAAKFVLVAVWCAVLTVMATLLGLVIGFALNLTGWSATVAIHGLAHLWIGVVLTVVVTLPLALVAGVGRGYMAPLGVAMLALVMAQIAGNTGRGAYFPWAIPGLYVATTSPTDGVLATTSLVIVLVTGAAGVLATLAWWLFADFAR